MQVPSRKSLLLVAGNHSLKRAAVALLAVALAVVGMSSTALAQTTPPDPSVPAASNVAPSTQADLAQMQAMMTTLDAMLGQLQQGTQPVVAPTVVRRRPQWI
jgi:hypothetical protein